MKSISILLLLFLPFLFYGQGYIPPYPGGQIVPSEATVDLSHITDLNLDSEKIQILDPGKMTEWGDVGSNPKVMYYLCLPGDFRHLGPLLLEDAADVYFIYYDGQEIPVDVYPWKEPEMAILEGLKCYTATNVNFYGITFSGNSMEANGLIFGPRSILNNTKDILISNCYFKYNRGHLRVRDFENFVIQNCFFDEVPKLGPDAGGVLLETTRGKISEGVMILNCEFKDMNDGFGINYNTGGDPANDPVGFVNNGLFENNDIYVTPEYYVGCKSCSENAIDLKSGATSWDNRIIIRRNRMWGFRPTDQDCGGSGDPGAAVTTHNNIQNVEFIDNIIWDSNVGWTGFGWNQQKWPEATVENVVWRNNLIFDIRASCEPNPDRPEDDLGGVAFRITMNDCWMINNTVVNVDHFYSKGSKKWPDVYFNCNIVQADDLGDFYSFRFGPTNFTIPQDQKSNLNRYRFEYCQHTGVQRKTVQFALLLEGTENGPRIPDGFSCDCGFNEDLSP